MILIPSITGGVGNQLYYVLVAIDLCIKHQLEIMIPKYQIKQSNDSRRKLTYVQTIFSEFKIDESNKSHDEYINDPKAIICKWEQLINSIELIKLENSTDKYIYLLNSADDIRPSKQIFSGKALTYARKQFKIPYSVKTYLNSVSNNREFKVVTIQVRLGDALPQQDNFYIHYDAYYRHVLQNYFNEKDSYVLVLISDSPNIVRRLSFWKMYPKVYLLDEDDATCWFFGIGSDHVICGNSTFGLTMALLCQSPMCKTFIPHRFRPEGRGIYKYKKSISYITPNDTLDFTDDESTHPNIMYIDIDDGPTSYFEYNEEIHPHITHELIKLNTC